MATSITMTTDDGLNIAVEHETLTGAIALVYEALGYDAAPDIEDNTVEALTDEAAGLGATLTVKVGA